MSGLSSSLQQLLADAVANKVAPGLVAVVSERGGDLVQAAAGHANNDSKTPLSVETIIWTASMSKVVVSLTALILGE